MHTVPDAMQSLPESVEALRALVLATVAERDAAVIERNTLLAQNDRLRNLLLKLTRMQFGAKSERLTEEQLQLGLEALEQAIAQDTAEAEKQDPDLRKDNATRRRASCGALPAHLPRPDDSDRGGQLRAAGCHPRAVPGDRDQASETGLPGLSRHCCAGTGASPTDRRWAADRGVGRACAGGPLCRSSAAVSPGADDGAARRSYRPRHAVVLDGRRWPKVPSAKPMERPEEGTRRPRWRLWYLGCVRCCWSSHGYSPMRPSCRCSTRGVAGPSRDTSGRLGAMTGHGPGRYR